MNDHSGQVWICLTYCKGVYLVLRPIISGKNGPAEMYKLVNLETAKFLYLTLLDIDGDCDNWQRLT